MAEHEYSKLWLQDALNKTATGRAQAAIAQSGGRALPCTVTAVMGSIVTVTFETTGIWTLPPLTLPKAESQWLRAPTQIGDKGLTIPADTYLGGISGLGDGVADLTKQYGNMTTLVWVPVGAVAFIPMPDPNKPWVNGPAGAVMSDTAQTASVITAKNFVQITTADGSMTITVDNTEAGDGVITIDCFGNTIVVTQDPSITMTSGDAVTKLDAALKKITHTVSNAAGPGASTVQTTIDGLANKVTHALTNALGPVQTEIDGLNSKITHTISSAEGELKTQLDALNNTITHFLPTGGTLGLGGTATDLGSTAKAMANADLSTFENSLFSTRLSDLENLATAVATGLASAVPSVSLSPATIIALIASLAHISVPGGGVAYIKPS